MNLRDTGKAIFKSVGQQATELSDQLRSQHLTRARAITAFAGIIQHEVGETGLLRSRSLERDHGLQHLYLKMEGNNPTGTQKDRIGFAHVLDALRQGNTTVGVATCGNYGAAVALATHLAGLACKVYIPLGYHTERIGEMEALGATIVRCGKTYEEAVVGSRQAALASGWYDANPGATNTALQIEAYSFIADEIVDQLKNAPAYCAVPVSNGTLLAGIYQGFARLYASGKTTRVPKMIAGSSVFKNPIVHSFNHGLTECVDLPPEKMKETPINEPLINWHSFDGNEALHSLYASDGKAYNVSDRKMKEMSTYLLQRESIRILPASTAGLVGLLNLHATDPLPADRYVAVLTARN